MTQFCVAVFGSIFTQQIYAAYYFDISHFLVILFKLAFLFLLID